jgi:hypothetical protein
MATPRMTTARTREDSAGYSDGRVALLWRLAKLDDEAVTTQLQHVRLQRLAAELLARQNASSALASLYMTMPNIAAMACWDPATGRVEIRCRQPLALTRVAADGSAQVLGVEDSTDFELAAGERLDWLGAVTLHGPDLPQGVQS